MSSLGANDASWYSNDCAYSGQDFLTVLNWGRPGLNNGVYSVLDHNSVYQSYTLVVGYTEQYIQAWYNNVLSCPMMTLMVGTSNSYECYNGTYNPSCSVYTAGVDWDNAIHSVMNWVASHHYDTRITIWGGDDLEGEWDQWTGGSGCPAEPTTLDFLNGVANQEATYSPHALLGDYGDASTGIGNNQCNFSPGVWTENDVYQASWGIGWDVPIPELYQNASYQGYQFNAWSQVFKDYQGQKYEFYGVMTECSEVDPLPSGQCYNQRNETCEWSPTIAMTNVNAKQEFGTWPYQDVTNIRWQDDSPSGNNGC